MLLSAGLELTHLRGDSNLLVNGIVYSKQPGKGDGEGTEIFRITTRAENTTAIMVGDVHVPDATMTGMMTTIAIMTAASGAVENLGSLPPEELVRLG